MSGLLIKDYKILTNQGRYMLTILGIFLLFLFTGNSASFMIGYVTFVMMFFTISTISYDEQDNGMAYLFTLPVSRQDYAREKYLFGAVVSGIFWLAAVVLTIIYRHFLTHQLMAIDEMTLLEFVTISLVLLLASWMMMSVFIPLELKYGTEKGRIVMFLIWGVLFGAMFILTKSVPSLGIKMTSFTERLDKLSPAAIMLAMLLVTAVFASVSLRISEGIMKAKEF